jgi:coenzyme F420-reducing hydrogenase beta subunit
MLINKDDNIRQQSSSGGVFTVIAEIVIVNNGVVFGAGFDGEFNVVHSWTDSVDSLSNFRGSKYVQSCIGDAYKEVLDFLKQGRQVVFFGTPCQIAGLRSYLGKDYEALICLDIICHGVPSPKVWQCYKLHMEEIY